MIVLRAFAALLGVASLVAGALWAWCGYKRQQSWTDWEAFAAHFVQDDGRVVDRTAGDRSTSEGQVYGLFFSLVANQPDRFSAMLQWTEDNLAGGDLTTTLPAWLWGERPDGTWGVIDANPASDADLWLAYALTEAARLWDVPRYAALARSVLALVKETEVVEIDGVGPLLLPAPDGFTSDNDLAPGVWRFNPSYLPKFQFDWLDAIDRDPQWAEMYANARRMVSEPASTGLAADWVGLADGETRFTPDPVKGPVGSYDAIRVYLWAGMSGDQTILGASKGYADHVSSLGVPPERVDVTTGEAEQGYAPIGFSGAVLPYLNALGLSDAVRAQRKRLKAARADGLYGQPPAYYDQVLTLFGLGWLTGRYRFGDGGELRPIWGCSCWTLISGAQ